MTTIIRTLIVDEELARERLKSLLQAESDIRIVGECPDGRGLVEFLRRELVDLIVLDVQLPELNGFEALRLVSAEQLPAVIFVTADDRYALQAFEFHALDYLTKPVDKTRLHAAITRVRLHRGLERFNIDLRRQVTNMLAELETQRPARDRIAVKSEGDIVFLYAEEIDWVESAGQHIRLHLSGKTLLVRDTLYGFEKKLSECKFLWISRSKLVNAGNIRTVQPARFGDYSVEMRNGAKLVLGRGYRRTFFESVESLMRAQSRPRDAVQAENRLIGSDDAQKTCKLPSSEDDECLVFKANRRASVYGD
jgi:two-component system LytT family response regulator